jgi:manganese/zinc/iron transport system permease protein
LKITLSLGGWQVPRAVLKMGAVVIFNAMFVLALFKELSISTFDPALSDTLGINSRLMNLALMAVVAMTAVAAFESVGSILVIAMLIVPAATAQLLTQRLAPLIVVAVMMAVLSAVMGHLGAITLPALVGFEDTNTAGMMAVASGVLFTLSALLGRRTV